MNQSINKIGLVILFICYLGINAIFAQKSITIYPTTENIKIDGELNEASWKKHLTDGNFIQSKPDNGKPSIRKTTISVLHDQNYLYILGVLYVPNKNEINNQLSARDDLGNSDFFGLQIDPFGKSTEGYDFTVTSAGVQADEKLSTDNGYSNFNVVWESAIKIYDDKWIVEMKIPFNSIRFPKEDLKDFRINFQRVSTKINEESFWNPVKPEVDGYLNQFGKLEGLKQVNPPLNLSFNPFVSIINETSIVGNSKTNFNGGLDLKYVHNNAYTLDVSLIPDFSQALSDNQVFNLSPFEIKYDENRQFFVEGTEIFDKGGYLYTRRIGGKPINKNNFNIASNEEIIDNPISSNIINLLKFTGKSEKGLSIGILNGITAKSEVEIKNTTTNKIRTIETNPLSNYNSIVIDKALKNNASLTFINNSVIRNGSDYDSNLTALLYKWYNKNRTYSMYFKKAFSQKYFSNNNNQFGHEYFAYLSKVSGNWTGGISAKLLDENFDNNDFGYLTRNNQLALRANVIYTNNNPKNTFTSYQFNFDHSQRYYYSLMQNEQTYYKLDSYANFKKNNHSIFTTFTYVQKGKDFYEPRVKDRYFIKPAFTETVLEYQTNQNKKVYFASYFVGVNYLKSTIYTNEFVTGYGLRARLGQHLFAKLEQDFSKNPNSTGFLTMQGNDIIFGKRSVKELTNSININYAVNAKMNISAKLRHYWIQVAYDKQFSLQTNGNLTENNYSINLNDYDENYNSFNIDFLAKWQFAPASEISFGYKLGSDFYNTDVKSSYFNNLKSTLKENNSNTISLKMTYFIDYNKLVSKRLF